MARVKTTKKGREKKVESKLTQEEVTQARKIENDIVQQTNDRIEQFRRSQQKSKNWMWLGIISLSAVIIFFWGWSLISNISLFNWKKTQENTLIKKTQNDWNKIFIETEKREAGKKQIKEKLSNLIEEFKKQAESENSTTTATTETTSTVTTNTISPSTTSTIR